VHEISTTCNVPPKQAYRPLLQPNLLLFVIPWNALDLFNQLWGTQVLVYW